MEKTNLPQSAIDDLLRLPKGRIGCGIRLQLMGFGRSETVFIQFKMMPYLEFFVQRQPEEPYLNKSIGFPRSSNDDKMKAALVTELNAAKGDAATYVEVLMKFYQAGYTQLQKNPHPKKTANSSNDSATTLQPGDIKATELMDELSEERLRVFANTIDKEYEDAMIDASSDWGRVTSYLISPEKTKHYYDEIRRKFPICFRVLALAASSSYYTITTHEEDVSESTEDELHRKHRMMLYIFYCLLRTKCKYHLLHWAQIEPMGLYYKGLQQPASQSMSGTFTSTLATCWKYQRKLYDKGLKTFNDKLEGEMRCSGAFDNYNEIYSKKTQTAGKSAIMHIGTVCFLKQDLPFPIPVGTIMISPSGVKARVVQCTYFDDTKYIISGEVLGTNGVGPETESEKDCIREGLMWPELGWKVQYMPGFAPRPSLTYADQVVQPPLNAWVAGTASNNDILFDRKRKIVEYNHPSALTLTSERYFELHQMSRRLIDIRAHART